LSREGKWAKLLKWNENDGIVRVKITVEKRTKWWGEGRTGE
jgi:hypothetical protein